MQKFNSGKFRILVIMIALAASLVSCGQAAQATPTSTSPTPPETKYTAPLRYGCNGCHVKDDSPELGPRFTSTTDLPNISSRGEIWIANPDYTGTATTNEEYLIESILQPEAFLIPGDWKQPMPTVIAENITEEELAELLAWMETFE